MPIRPPALDDRSFDDLVAELLARIPAHTPEWTDPRPGDPGRTILELFAWLADTLLYRVNLTPEKQRLAFLRLLGIPLKPAVAARGLISLSLSTPADTGVHRIQPLARVTAPVDVETRDELAVLPVTLQVYVKRKLTAAERQRYGSVTEGLRSIYSLSQDQNPTPYFTVPIFNDGKPEPNGFMARDRTVDGCYWLALLASAQKGQVTHNEEVRQALGGGSEAQTVLLNIGVVPTLALPADFADFGQRQQIPHVWEISTGRLVGGEPEYLPLQVVGDSTNRLLRQGVVRVALPAAARIGAPATDVRSFLRAGVGNHPPRLDSPQIAARLVAWIRLRPLPPASLAGKATTSQPPDLQLSWLGINAVEVDQRRTVEGRVIGESNGLAGQEFALPGQSVEPETLIIEVEESGRGYQRWQQVEDLVMVGRDVPAYRLDSEAGTIRFGDGVRGRIPEISRRIRVARLRAGGGRQGNLPAGSLTAILARDWQGKPLNSQFQVLQPLPLAGGEDAETLAEAEQRIPALFRHRDRAVTESDYRHLAAQTPGVRLGRVELLPHFKPQQRRTPIPGVVSVLVLPQQERLQPPNPRPDRPTLERVHAWLEQRRPLATELYVIGCEYVPLGVSVGIEIQDGFGQDGVLQAVKDALQAFLWPLRPGGLKGEGWPLGRSVQELELEVMVSRVPGVGGVNGLRLFQRDAEDRWKRIGFTGRQPASLRLDAWQLPELLEVVVSIGPAAGDLDPPHPLGRGRGGMAPPAAGDQEGIAGAGTGGQEGIALPSSGDQVDIPIPVMPEIC